MCRNDLLTTECRKMKMDIIGVRGLRCNIVQFFATLFAEISADSSSKSQFHIKIDKIELKSCFTSPDMYLS